MHALLPGAKLAAPHRHPGQLETFSLISGALEMKLADQWRTVTAGEEVAVPMKSAHAWGNTSDGFQPDGTRVDRRD